jgi:integrase
MKLLKYKTFKGLHVVCKKCNRNIEVSQDQYKGCNHPIERQRYKAMVKINGRRPSKDLKSLDYDGAIKEFLYWKEDLNKPYKLKLPNSSSESKPELFEECIWMFSDWLENVGLPVQEQKQRSLRYVIESVGIVTRFKDFLVKNGYNLKKLTVYQVDKFVISDYYEYLEKKYENPSTFNHQLRPLKSFFNCLINVKGYDMPNPTKGIRLKYENPDPKSVNDTDFLKLLSVVTKKDSIHTYENGVRKNMYRPYIKTSFELAAFTGMRLKEVAMLKFSDIVLDSDEGLSHIKGTDLKFELTHNWAKNKESKIVNIPRSPELEDLLNRLDYKNNIGSDKYLIDGDSKISRESLAKQMSHSFTFFRRKAGLGDIFSIKHLRKTFLTRLQSQTGLAQSAGYQKTAKVILNNYIVKDEIVEAIAKKGFSYFNKQQIGQI